MHSDWEPLADHLRAELQGYGGLLQLFNEQQDNLLRGDAEAVLSYAHEIEAQVRATGELRARREGSVRDFAAGHGQPPDSTLRKLLAHFPAEVQPLLAALIDEVNRLIRSVRLGVRRNHEFLSRAVQMHQETLRALRPEAFTKTYSPQGEVNIAGDRPAWQAAG